MQFLVWKLDTPVITTSLIRIKEMRQRALGRLSCSRLFRALTSWILIISRVEYCPTSLSSYTSV